MKKAIKLYLEQNDLKLLKEKASKRGFTGRGSLAQYISLIARTDLIILNDDVQKFSKILNVQIQKTK